MGQAWSANTVSRPVASVGQRRHASQSSDVAAPPSSSTRGRLDAALQKFSAAVNTQMRSFDIQAAWDAYDGVKACKDAPPLAVADLLSFAEKVMARAEREYTSNTSLQTLHQWGHRLQGLLEDLEPQIVHQPDLAFQRQCMMARATALVGDLQEATKLASDLFVSATGLLQRDASVKTFENILLSARRHFDATQALEVLFAEWGTLGYLLMSDSPGDAAARRTIHSIVKDISQPARLLASRNDWDPGKRLRLANLLLAALCEFDLPHDAYAVLLEMRSQGLAESTRLQLALLRALVRADAFELANTLFSTLAVTHNKHYLQAALYLFTHQGHVAKAVEYFTQIEQHGLVTAASIALLLQVHAMHGKIQETISLFHKFFPTGDPDVKAPIPPNVIHFTTVIHAHAVRGDLDGMNHWLETLLKAGLTPDTYVYTVILKAFAKRGDIDSVGTVIDQMHAAGHPPKAATYTVVLSLLARRKDPVAAEAIYKRAMREGVTPDRRMISAMMNAHVEAGTWRGVIRVFDFLKSNPNRHLKLSIEVYNTLLKAYVLIGAPFKLVSNIFHKLGSVHVRPDARTYALLIQSACDAGLMWVASEIFMEMERLSTQWKTNIHMNVYVLTIIMSGFLRKGQRLRAKAVFDDMRQRGIEPTMITYGSIVRAYANKGSQESIKIAEAFIKTLIENESKEQPWVNPTGGRRHAMEHVFSPLMSAYARQQKPEDVERSYQLLLDNGGEPTIGILTTLLDGRRRTGDIDAVLQIWHQIYDEALRYSRIDPIFGGDGHVDNPGTHRQSSLLCVPLSIYADALSAAGMHQEISTIWRTLQVQGFAFDSHNWNHLAVALVRAGQPERAFEILEKVLLPYRRQSVFVQEKRDENPETPLSFDQQAGNTPASSDPLHSGVRREAAARLAYRKLRSDTLGLDDVENEDFAHPLHILHQISPAWNIWVPHSIVVRLLIMVLRHLESGMLVRPVQAGGNSFAPERDPESRRAMMQTAEGMLKRIHDNFPQAVAIVRERERRIRVRGHKVWREQ
jgi:pentatricopeptide repeat-containing protein PET309